MKPITYISKNITINGERAADFMRQWKELTTEDKNTLVRYAEEEMNALGIDIG